MLIDSNFIVYAILSLIVATGCLRVVRRQIVAFSLGIVLYSSLRIIPLLEHLDPPDVNKLFWTLSLSRSAGEFTVAFTISYFLLKRLWVWDDAGKAEV